MYFQINLRSQDLPRIRIMLDKLSFCFSLNFKTTVVQENAATCFAVKLKKFLGGEEARHFSYMRTSG